MKISKRSSPDLTKKKELLEAASRRMKRLAYLGHIGRAGLRCPVSLHIKDENHKARKMFRPKNGPDGKQLVIDGIKQWEVHHQKTSALEHPRWRSILVQGTLDFMTSHYLRVSHQKAYIELPTKHDAVAIL